MSSLRTAGLFALVFAVLVFPATGHALQKGTARLVSVTPVDGGCVMGPTGFTTEAWDIQPGHTYTIRLEDVTECANGGTDPTLDVRVNSSIPGHEYTDLVATNVAPGVYEFDFTLPANAWCTLPILYCTTPGEWLTTGLFVRRHDGATNSNGVPYTSHLRASTWDAGCTNPEMIIGPECGTVPVEESSWGVIKSLYH
ncbi:MAG: hypothetical protein PVF33_06285 [Candidatus Latescibacterota bacterium]|jgi:hypothetical protein